MVTWVRSTFDKCLVDDEVLSISELFGETEKLLLQNRLSPVLDKPLIERLIIVLNETRIHLRRIECTVLRI